jgi:4-amino-4-deoxy-L-arabinose transferase-like glycosyltransferase
VPLAAAALVAFNPQFIFAHALVSNDPLLITLASGLLYLSVVLLDTQRRALALAAGALLGQLLITKGSALALVPLPLAALELRGNLRRAMIDGLLVLGSAALIAGWWYLRNARLYGDPLGIGAFQATFATGDFRLGAWQDWRTGLWNLLRSSWGNFGWLSLPLNDGAYYAFGAVLLLALIGLLTTASRDVWRGHGRVAWLLLLALGLVCGWTVSFARVAGMVAWQGRFLFPAASALAILLAVGLGAVLPGRAALWALVGTLATLAIAVPPGIIAPAYPSYVLPAAAADFGNVYGRFDVGWKRGVELRDVQFPRTALQGDTIDVDLRWHALEQMDRPWSVFVHLAGPDKQILDESNAEPLSGTFPTDGWVGGDWIADRHQLRITHAPPGRYMLWIGLWDPATGARLGVYDRADALAGDRVEVGPITVTAR